jgi:hypothetical protein
VAGAKSKIIKIYKQKNCYSQISAKILICQKLNKNWLKMQKNRPNIVKKTKIYIKIKNAHQ